MYTCSASILSLGCMFQYCFISASGISRMTDVPCEVLHLDFSGCPELQYLGGRSAGGCLVGLVSLHTLQLDLTNCRSLSAISVLDEIQSSLRVFHLRMSHCTSLVSVEMLVMPLEQLTLTDLELNMSGCRSLSDLGQLSTQLRAQLTLERLRLNFCGCAIPPEAAKNSQGGVVLPGYLQKGGFPDIKDKSFLGGLGPFDGCTMTRSISVVSVSFFLSWI